MINSWLSYLDFTSFEDLIVLVSFFDSFPSTLYIANKEDAKLSGEGGVLLQNDGMDFKEVIFYWRDEIDPKAEITSRKDMMNHQKY